MSIFKAKEFKNLTEEDRKYLSDINAAVLFGAPVKYHFLTIIMISFIVIAIYWAKHAMLDEVTRGTGKVVPAIQIQTVQNLEGGILTKIYVDEGSLVEKGQKLMRLDDVQFSGKLTESTLKHSELLANQARLSAEVKGEKLVLPKKILRNYPILAKRVTQLYKSRIKQHKAETRVLEEKVLQKQQAILEQGAKINQLKTGLKLLREEIQMSEPLVAAGAISEVEILRLKRSENDVSGELITTESSIPRLKSELQEAKSLISENNIKYQSEAQAEHNEVKAELDQISATLGEWKTGWPEPTFTHLSKAR